MQTEEQTNRDRQRNGEIDTTREKTRERGEFKYIWSDGQRIG